VAKIHNETVALVVFCKMLRSVDGSAPAVGWELNRMLLEGAGEN
jgi:hypothetical protein